MRNMALVEVAKVAKGGEGGKAGVADSDSFSGVLCAALICRLHHLYRLFRRLCGARILELNEGQLILHLMCQLLIKLTPI